MPADPRESVYNFVTKLQRIKSIVKITFQIFGVLLFLAGLVFFLQGINVLPGSYMTGDPQWVINGGMIMAIGLGMFFWVNRRR